MTKCVKASASRDQNRSFWKNHLFLPVCSELLYFDSSNFFTSLRAFCLAVGLVWVPMSSVVTTDLSSTSSKYRVGIKCV